MESFPKILISTPTFLIGGIDWLVGCVNFKGNHFIVVGVLYIQPTSTSHPDTFSLKREDANFRSSSSQDTPHKNDEMMNGLDFCDLLSSQWP